MAIPKTKGFRDDGERCDHFGDHGTDFGATDRFHYEALADQFITAATRTSFYECHRRQGDFVRFDRATEEFCILAHDGYIRTYFKPKRCATIPLLLRRKIRCHNFLTHLEYVIDTCTHY